MIGALPFTISAACLATHGKTDIAGPAGAAVDGVDYCGVLAATMTAIAPGADAPSPAGEAATAQP